MRLLPSLLLSISTAHEIESHWDPVSQTVQHHSVEMADEVLGDDIVFSPCQAETYRRRGFNITEDLVLDGIGDDPSCIEEADGQVAPQALTGTVPRWKENFNSQTNKYEVGWYFISGFDNDRKEAVRIKLAEFARDTCVDLVEVQRSDRNYANKLEIQQSNGCSSYVGRHFEEQMLSLSKGCEKSYVPLHEVMHALGWYHEQQRADRDDHVKVWQERCTMTGSSWTANQGKMSEDRWVDQGSPYDFGSIMHYGVGSCRKSGVTGDVITKPDGSELTLTKGSSLSEHDIFQINQIYDCGAAPTTTANPNTTPTNPSTTSNPNTRSTRSTRPPRTSRQSTTGQTTGATTPSTTSNPFTTGTNPQTTAPPGPGPAECCQQYRLNRIDGSNVNKQDIGVYVYKGEHNGRPYWKNNRNEQKLFYSEGKPVNGPHWRTHRTLQDRMFHSYSTQANPGCPEEHTEWNNPTEIICMDGTSTTTGVSKTVTFVADFFIKTLGNRRNNKTVYYGAVNYWNSFDKVNSSSSHLTTINNWTNNFHYWTYHNWPDHWLYYTRYHRTNHFHNTNPIANNWIHHSSSASWLSCPICSRSMR